MISKRVVVSKGVTISVGKFESVRVDAQVELELEKGEDEDTAFETGFAIVDEQVNKQMAELQDVMADTSVFKVKREDKPVSRKRQQ